MAEDKVRVKNAAVTDADADYNIVLNDIKPAIMPAPDKPEVMAALNTMAGAAPAAVHAKAPPPAILAAAQPLPEIISESEVKPPQLHANPAHTFMQLPLFLEAVPKGNILTKLHPDTSKNMVQAEALLQLLQPVINAEEYARLQSLVNAEGYIALKHVNSEGVTVTLDEQALAIVTSVPFDNKQQRSIQARASYTSEGREVVPQSPVSAYVNLRANQDYVHNTPDNDGDERQPLRLTTDGAVNIEGWVLEGSAEYLEGEERLWERQDIRLVRDMPEDMMRFSAGDLSYPVSGFQSFQPLLGLSVARNFDLQPYRVSEPTGRTSFLLKSPSRVDIYVNEVKVRTLQLDSGPYDLSDFPVVNGLNDVRLVITDATGRVEEKVFNVISDNDLLEEGLHEFSYSAGVPSTQEDRERTYEADTPSVSAFHRYGLTENMTTGVSLQASRDVQMGGLNVVLGSAWGTVRTEAAFSNDEDGQEGFASSLIYQLVNPKSVFGWWELVSERTLSVLLQQKSERFVTLGQNSTINPYHYEANIRYTQPLSGRMNIGLGTRYQYGRGQEDNNWASSISLDKQFGKGFRVGMNAEHRREQGTGVFLNFTWTPPASRHFVNATHDSYSKNNRVDWNYAAIARSESMSATAGLAEQDGNYTAVGTVTYSDDRAEFTVGQDVLTSFNNDAEGEGVTGTEHISRVRFATALAYAGGQVALSRPITESFVIVDAHPSLDAQTIGVNSQGNFGGKELYEAKIDGLGPAVLPELTSYTYRSVNVDSSNIPLGFTIDQDRFTAFPGYKSGTYITIGSDSNVLADGILQFASGEPVALEAGYVRSENNEGKQDLTFFTNRKGRFRIDKLKPGNYELVLHNYADSPVAFSIAEDSAGFIKMGTLTLHERKQ